MIQRSQERRRPGRRTFVCFTCRTTERVPVGRLTRRCRKCRAPAEYVYYKFRIPRVKDDKGWRALMQSVRELNRAIATRALHWLRARADRYARALPSQPPHRRRTFERLLRDVEEEIRAYE